MLRRFARHLRTAEWTAIARLANLPHLFTVLARRVSFGCRRVLDERNVTFDFANRIATIEAEP